MLIVSEHASEVIETLVTRPDAPQDAALRIGGTNDGQESMAVAIARPRPGDQSVDGRAPVVIASEAAATLEAMVLDVDVDEHGRVQFVLEPQ